MFLLILNKSNAFMDKKIPACYFCSLLNNDVLSYHPSLRLIDQVRFNVFLFPQNPLSERQNFLCFWQKVKYTFCVFFVCKQTSFTIPAIFVGALRSITSGGKQVKKFAKTSDQSVKFVFYKPRGQMQNAQFKF